MIRARSVRSALRDLFELATGALHVLTDNLGPVFEDYKVLLFLNERKSVFFTDSATLSPQQRWYTGHGPTLDGTQRYPRSMGQLALKHSALPTGSGGRQSISGVVATVFGATGFLGRYVVSMIGEQGGRVVCPHRCDDLDMQHLRPMGDLGNIITLQEFSIRDEAAVKKVISKSNVVINLIGQKTETWNFGFKEVRSIASLCYCAGTVDMKYN
jgi:hypothetical protein